MGLETLNNKIFKFRRAITLIYSNPSTQAGWKLPRQLNSQVQFYLHVGLHASFSEQQMFQFPASGKMCRKLRSCDCRILQRMVCLALSTAIIVQWEVCVNFHTEMKWSVFGLTNLHHLVQEIAKSSPDADHSASITHLHHNCTRWATNIYAGNNWVVSNIYARGIGGYNNIENIFMS